MPQSPETWTLIQWVAALLPLVTAGMVGYTFYQGRKFQREMKILDVVAMYQRRFDEIRFNSIGRVGTAEGPSADDYWRRFWNLQLEQFNQWFQGYIPDDTYRYWMNSRVSERNRGWSVGGKTAKEGWEGSMDVMEGTGYFLFMSIVFDSGVDQAMHYAKKDGKKLLRAKTAAKKR